MHILFDARTISLSSTRIAIYAKSIFEALIPTLEGNDLLTILITPAEKIVLPHTIPKMTLYRTTHPARSVAGLRQLKRIVKEIKPDLYWSLDPLIPAMNIRMPHIYAISDLYPCSHPEMLSYKERFLWWFYGKKQLIQARRIICCNKVLQMACRKRLGEKVSNKTLVIFHGVHESFRPHSSREIEALRQKHVLPEKYMLFLGADTPHKNLNTILHAFTAKNETSSIPLIIAGYHSDTPHRRHQVKEMELTDMVRFLGKVSHEELSVLYSGAWLVLHPSTIESFSQTIIQAMACGAPVLCSAVPENEELFGNAVIRLHPIDSTEWRHSMLTLTISTVLRERLSKHGIRQAARYTWQETARKTLACFKDIIGDHV